MYNSPTHKLRCFLWRKLKLNLKIYSIRPAVTLFEDLSGNLRINFIGDDGMISASWTVDEADWCNFQTINQNIPSGVWICHRKFEKVDNLLNIGVDRRNDDEVDLRVRTHFTYDRVTYLDGSWNYILTLESWKALVQAITDYFTK